MHMTTARHNANRTPPRACVGIAALLLIFALTVRTAAQQEQPVLFADKSPAELYRIVHQAKWKVDTATVLACTSRRAGASEESVYRRLMQERSTLPQSLKVLKEDIVKTTATLKLQGQRRDRETGKIVTSRGTVTLIKEDGTWRIRHETWAE